MKYFLILPSKGKQHNKGDVKKSFFPPLHTLQRDVPVYKRYDTEGQAETTLKSAQSTAAERTREGPILFSSNGSTISSVILLVYLHLCLTTQL